MATINSPNIILDTPYDNYFNSSHLQRNIHKVEGVYMMSDVEDDMEKYMSYEPDNNIIKIDTKEKVRSVMLVESCYIKTLEKKINRYLREGWEMSGDAFGSKDEYIQKMVKY